MVLPMAKGICCDRMEYQAVFVILDTEEYLVGQCEVAAETPQHVRRIELGKDIAVVEVEILLIGTE